jgi:mRNA interferase MazF
VVQSDDLPLSTWLIAPTSTGGRAASFRPEIEINDTKIRNGLERHRGCERSRPSALMAGRVETNFRAVGAVVDRAVAHHGEMARIRAP